MPLAGERSRGWNLYFPIPYARHCLITSDEGGFYYHVNYRSYPATTAVTTFQPADALALQAEIDRVVNRLTPARRGLMLSASVATERGRLEVTPGASVNWTLTGGGAISELRLRVEAEDAPRALRSVLLRMSFDGQDTVLCPLGDFFGAGPGLKPYQSLPVGIDEDGALWCRWFMPFRDECRVQLANHGTSEVRVDLSALRTPYHWTTRSMYFHTGWRMQRDAPTRPFID